MSRVTAFNVHDSPHMILGITDYIFDDQMESSQVYQGRGTWKSAPFVQDLQGNGQVESSIDVQVKRIHFTTSRTKANGLEEEQQR